MSKFDKFEGYFVDHPTSLNYFVYNILPTILLLVTEYIEVHLSIDDVQCMVITRLHLYNGYHWGSLK